MATYTKRPVSVEAVQWTGENYEEVMDWGAGFGPEFAQQFMAIGSGTAILAGSIVVHASDWIVRYPDGAFTAHDAAAFGTLYEVGSPEDPAPVTLTTTLVALLNIGGPPGDTYVESVSFTAAADDLAQGQYQLRLVQETSNTPAAAPETPA